AVSGDGTTKLTSTGLMVGTPLYMSPEQFVAARPVDGRADQYSLACVLYEMLIGEPPFSGPNPLVVLARHTQDPVPSLRTVRPTIPDALEQVIFRALSKVPADRFDTMGEFADAMAEATEAPIVYGTADYASPVTSARALMQTGDVENRTTLPARRTTRAPVVPIQPPLPPASAPTSIIVTPRRSVMRRRTVAI